MSSTMTTSLHRRALDEDEGRHEAKYAGEPAASDALADKFAVAIYNNTVTAVRSSTLRNQERRTDGALDRQQLPTAGRELGNAIADAVAAQLRQFRRSPFGSLRCPATARRWGWRGSWTLSCRSPGGSPAERGSGNCPRPGGGDVVLGLPAPKPSYDALLALLRQAGLDARSEVRADLKCWRSPWRASRRERPMESRALRHRSASSRFRATAAPSGIAARRWSMCRPARSQPAFCHIKGNKPGSKRHDPNQSETERQGFANLLLMCPIHHDVIDGG